MAAIGDLELVLDAQAELGEGPSWDVAAADLLWVDIPRGLVHRTDPVTGRDATWDVGQAVGAAVPTTSGRIALATRDGFSLLDPATGAIELVAEVEPDDARTMMNDGACDPAGRFWAGTKHVEGRRPLGSLYRLDAGRHLERMLSGVTISNGLGWSPDDRTMYYVDSVTHAIDRFAFDLATGAIEDRRRLVDLPEAYGLPDGMTVDEEGFLWVAFWGGSAVRRLAPDGRVVETVDLPVTQVTSCAFGGEDLGDLYITTARDGVAEEDLRTQPMAGGLFRLRLGVRGLPQAPFAG